jgi:hypothetical protein
MAKMAENTVVNELNSYISNLSLVVTTLVTFSAP